MRIQHDKTTTSEKLLAVTPVIVLSPCLCPVQEHAGKHTFAHMQFLYFSVKQTLVLCLFMLLRKTDHWHLPMLRFLIGADTRLSLEDRPDRFLNQVTGYAKNLASEANTPDRLSCFWKAGEWSRCEAHAQSLDRLSVLCFFVFCYVGHA